ncbi:MAG: metallophosphoesterase [Magnetococcales bacterium]|nr:metallophosphoesterase [Magnetococcales bacterium]
MMWRSLVAILVGLATVLLGVVVNDESQNLEVTRHVIGRAAGENARGLRIAQVSDLHMQGDAAVEQQTLQVLREEDPDLLVLTGDILARRDRMVALKKFLEQLPARARKIALLGNWEYWAGIDLVKLRRLYTTSGVTLLVNEAVRIDEGVLVVGLDDERHGQPDMKQALAAHPGWQGPMLVLAHNPITLTQLSQQELVADHLMLAGHTHGGQIVLLGRWLQREQPCRAGWCPDREASIYISRGVGTTVIPLRFGARPELALFEWWVNH